MGAREEGGRQAGGRLLSPAALPLEGEKDTCEPANSTEVSARCPRRATTVFFPSPNTSTSASRGRQSDNRMCTRPAHAHTCVAASGAHSPSSVARGRGSTGRVSFFLGVGLTLFVFLRSCLMLPFALPLFLRALLGSLFCCLPSWFAINP